MSAFLRNVWQMAGWAEDVGEALLSRRIAFPKVLPFRAEEGGPPTRKREAGAPPLGAVSGEQLAPAAF